MVESTALGAAFLAAVGAGFCSVEDIKLKRKVESSFIPKMPENVRNEMYSGWKKAVEKSKI
jgi:glycerol kinase